MNAEKKVILIFKSCGKKFAVVICFMFIIFMLSNKAYPYQDTIKISAIQDNTLYEDAGGTISNGQGKFMFSGKGNTGLIRRGVMRFLIVEFLPPCSKILSVSLKMHLSGGDAANRNIQLRKIEENWSEGSSNAPGLEENGTSATSFDATWKHRYYSSDYWAAIGGTYSATSRGSAVVGAPGYYTWNSTPEMVNDVQFWLDDNSQAFGWLLLGDESASSTAKRFHTSESDTFAFVPEITVIYKSSVFELYMESLIEGFWDGSNTADDTMKVKLRSTVSPFAVVETDASVMYSGGGNFCFFDASPGDYYISVHHRNSLETWSKNPINFALNEFEIYDFTDDIAKAYGDNEVLKLLEYCFYSGDQNQNGVIDITDVLNIYNDANVFLAGYVPSDVTGDNIVDITDVLTAYNNANNFVTVMKP